MLSTSLLLTKSKNVSTLTISCWRNIHTPDERCSLTVNKRSAPAADLLPRNRAPSTPARLRSTTEGSGSGGGVGDAGGAVTQIAGRSTPLRDGGRSSTGDGRGAVLGWTAAASALTADRRPSVVWTSEYPESELGLRNIAEPVVPPLTLARPAEVSAEPRRFHSLKCLMVVIMVISRHAMRQYNQKLTKQTDLNASTTSRWIRRQNKQVSMRVHL